MSVGSEAMNYADLAREVGNDWLSAVHSKKEVEERRMYDYRLYRRFRNDVSKLGFAEAASGPFGWSKLTVPVIFWIVETIVPRLAVNPPTLIVRPMSGEAVPYAQAKELELQQTLDLMRVRSTMHRTLKQTVLYGDGPTKLSWDSVNGRPRFTGISWFDWFLSPDARTPEDAEVIYHRAWYTRRQLQRLSKLTDRNGKPLFYGLDRVAAGESVEAADSTWAARREASGQGPEEWSATGGLFCLIECWYQDGTVVVLGGQHGDLIVQVRTSPFRDESGMPVRPFVVFGNTPDPESPYSIGDAEMLEDHQSELSTLRNQAIDQTTVNLNGPVIYSGSVKPEEVDAAFGAPGGKMRVQGDVRNAVMRMAPGNVSSDFYNFYNNVRDETQFISGVNDNQAGQAAAREQTATEITRINDEANKRWQFKIAITEERFAELGHLIDLAIRRYGAPGASVQVPKGTAILPDQRGLMGLGGEAVEPGESAGGFARTSPFMNTDGAVYAVQVKAGSLAMPSELAEFQKVMALVGALSQNEPMMGFVKWQEVVKLVVQVAGYDPQKILMSEDEIAQQQMVAQLEQMLAAQPAPGSAPASAGPMPA